MAAGGLSGTLDAVVLTGGRGSRLGGVVKAELDLGGGPLIDGVLRALAGAGLSRAVVVGPAPARVPDGLDVHVTREDPPFGGPAAAVEAALPLVQAPWLLLLACDLPRAADVVGLLLDGWSDAGPRAIDGADGIDGLVLVDDEQHPQWLAAVYARTALADALRSAARAATLGGRHGVRMGDVVRGLRLRTVTDTAGASRDVDTPADVEWWRSGSRGTAPTTEEGTTVEHSEKTGRVPGGALGDWLAELQGLLGVEDRIDVDAVLDVARDVAHGVARPAAPLSTFVLGLAVGRASAAGTPVGEELERLAALVQTRALEHGGGDGGTSGTRDAEASEPGAAPRATA